MVWEKLPPININALMPYHREKSMHAASCSTHAPTQQHRTRRGKWIIPHLSKLTGLAKVLPVCPQAVISSLQFSSPAPHSSHPPGAHSWVHRDELFQPHLDTGYVPR